MATDSAGATVWQANYTPFGGIHQVSVNTGALTAQDLRFPGQWFQSETGLHQNWHRDYDPTTGRYLQADPLGLVDGPSVYGYARMGPTMYADPTGQCPACAGFAYAAGAGIIISLLLELAENGGKLACVNWFNVGLGGVLGGLTGGLGSIGGKYALTTGLKNNLSNGTKGKIGEIISAIKHSLKGNKKVGKQENINENLSTIVDFIFQKPNGERFFVESKFGTSGLTKPQRVALKTLGAGIYQVEKWTYAWLGGVGSGFGITAGTSAGAAAAYANRMEGAPCDCR